MIMLDTSLTLTFSRKLCKDNRVALRYHTKVTTFEVKYALCRLLFSTAGLLELSKYWYTYHSSQVGFFLGQLKASLNSAELAMVPIIRAQVGA